MRNSALVIVALVFAQAVALNLPSIYYYSYTLVNKDSNAPFGPRGFGEEDGVNSHYVYQDGTDYQESWSIRKSKTLFTSNGVTCKATQLPDTTSNGNLLGYLDLYFQNQKNTTKVVLVKNCTPYPNSDRKTTGKLWTTEDSFDELCVAHDARSGYDIPAWLNVYETDPQYDYRYQIDRFVIGGNHFTVNSTRGFGAGCRTAAHF